jgi:hypothetical protein
MNWKKITMGTVAFFISSFVIQGLLGFVLGGDYFLSITIMRPNPIAYLSMSSTIFAGIAIAILYPITNLSGTPLLRGLKFGFLTGVMMTPFVALDIPGRFMIPSESTWILLQGVLGLVHSSVAGILIGLIYGKDTK